MALELSSPSLQPLLPTISSLSKQPQKPTFFCSSSSSSASSSFSSSSSPAAAASSSSHTKFLAFSSPRSFSRASASLPSVPSLTLSLLSAPAASAVSYDDVALPEPAAAAAAATAATAAASDIDITSIVDSVSSFAVENPLAIIAGVAAIGLPILVSSLFSQPKPWGSVSAKDAYKKLSDPELDIQLLDIRGSEDVKVEGTPDLREFKKRVFQIPYSGSDDEAYLKKLLAKFKDPANTSLLILDQFDGNSIALAKYVTANGFKSALAIKDGAEGPNGWRKNELPWLLPRKGFQLDIGSLKDVIDSTFSENPNLVPATLGVAAAAGVGLVVFSEAETALQLLGSAALIQLFVKKFLFAKDRQKTLKELQTFLDTKIAPKELVDELKGIGGVLVPKYNEISPDSTNGAVTTDAAPAVPSPVESEPVAVESSTAASEKVEEVKPDAITEESVNSTSASSELPQCSTPLSPYTQFPDLKPPTSPTPSRP